ncbi:predicted protein [Aspergillus nidulans FGSC A4]|uniref:Uncharacterized protein n=1 Tax=Emericella nidulans (strain FGSC A4 / ATCC 38163 / CBS 112.46 / NRRL 194 / M139) TaxID=227321 RepID=Q5B7B2_EMENI|nr:hypothetical protein [Aspergillus nidulans FGSC A4]EAA59776.1 predicted protein [Aspergillus nidulans FGSC A4]CBF75870.1 TPA: conserved hypothetical protein [Aspergillus nidulans FGSC A4]|eukprot:XP_661172.1 predicted protein [Aspergillus nidulans FGSC A4]
MLIQTVALYLARFIASLAVITGPFWFVNHNLAFQIFGLPKTIASQQMAAFGPAIGGRNMSLGTLIILASYYLTYQQTGLALALIATGSGWSDSEGRQKVEGGKRGAERILLLQKPSLESGYLAGWQNILNNCHSKGQTPLACTAGARVQPLRHGLIPARMMQTKGSRDTSCGCLGRVRASERIMGFSLWYPHLDPGLNSSWRVAT